MTVMLKSHATSIQGAWLKADWQMYHASILQDGLPQSCTWAAVPG